MKILIVTTRSDRSFGRIVEEGEKRGISVDVFFYEKLRIHEIDNFAAGYDFCILRDPYNTGRDFSVYLRHIMSLFKPSIVLDYGTYAEHPFYEDKLYQHMLFSRHIRMPKLYHYNIPEMVNIRDFPVVVKRRISSRGKGVYVIQSTDELKRFVLEHEIHEFIFTDYIEIKADIRVFVLGGKVICSVERRRRFKNRDGYRGVGVKVTHAYNIPSRIRLDALKAAELIKTDFCGVDFLIDIEGRHYMLECNISPQFIASERATGINIASMLIDFITSKIK